MIYIVRLKQTKQKHPFLCLFISFPERWQEYMFNFSPKNGMVNNYIRLTLALNHSIRTCRIRHSLQLPLPASPLLAHAIRTSPIRHGLRLDLPVSLSLNYAV